MFEKFEKLEKNKEWDDALSEIEAIIIRHPNNVEACIRVIYFLHNFLVEEMGRDDLHSLYEGLLLKYYNEGVTKFYKDAEFLFFIGLITHIAEWYFGLYSDFKVEDQKGKVSIKMQKKAYELDPDNKLFEFMYKSSIWEEEKGSDLHREIIKNESYLDWLRSKGFPGRYILEIYL